MIIFLYGEDHFRSRQKLLEIKQKYLNSDKSGSGLSLFDLEDKVKIAEITDVLGMPNLLSPKRLVIVKNALNAPSENQKIILEYLKENKKRILSDKDLVAVFWERNVPKKNNSLFKFLEKESQKQNFEKMDGAKFFQWALKTLKKIDPKASISKAALDRLVVYVGNDSQILENEIRKLTDFADGKMISEKDVEILVKANIDSNIFATIDALAAGNKKEAMCLLHNNLAAGEDPFYVMSMFVYQFRNMLKIADLKDRGISSEYEVSKITKMHPFVIRKTMAHTRTFDFIRLKKIFEKLGKYDQMAKTGKIDIRLALDKFVAEI